MNQNMVFLNDEYTINRNKPYNRLNWDYIAGIYDAEGCNQTYINKCDQKISQKSDPVLLKRILKYMKKLEEYQK